MREIREIERERANLEAAEDSSSSQWRICLTLRLRTVTDCLTSLLNSITTAPTPATVNMKFVNPIFFRSKICEIRFWEDARDLKRAYVFFLLGEAAKAFSVNFYGP